MVLFFNAILKTINNSQQQIQVHYNGFNLKGNFDVLVYAVPYFFYDPVNEGLNFHATLMLSL